MQTRRSLLALATGLATAGIAGCAGFLGSDGSRHYVDVLNGSDAAHTFAVTALDSEGDVLFDQEYDLDPNAGDENRIIEGQPATVEVAVDGGEPTAIQWEPRSDSSFVTTHPDGCPEATSTSLTLWYTNGNEAVLEASFGCETVA